MSDSSHQSVESLGVDSDNESIHFLRDLVERLSTSEGKTISWKALSKLVEVQDPSSLLEPLEECLSDGCRIIRELPVRSLSNAAENKTDSSTFKFQVPYSMRCLAEPNAFLADEEVSEGAASTEKGGAERWSVDSRAERLLSNNKKRKSVRAQTYLKREAEATTDDMSRADEVHDADYGSDESRFKEMSEEKEDGNESYDDVEVPRRFWYRRKEDRRPFSHEAKVRRLKAVQARCRIRRIKKAREGLEKQGDKKGEGDVNDESAKGNEADKPPASSSSNSKKPSRVERRAAALRRENGGGKARPTLAELRARIGKGAAKDDEDAAQLSHSSTKQATSPAPLPAALPPSRSSSSGTKKAAGQVVAAAVVPTCAFTFTSRSMAANRLVSMRAELDTLHKNLQEARKDFEDLRRLERESAAGRVVGAVDASTSTTATTTAPPAATTAYESHDKMMQSVKALTASCKAVTSVAAAATQKDFKVQADTSTTVAKAKPSTAATAMATNHSSTARVAAGTGNAASSKVAPTTTPTVKPLPPTAPPSVPPPPPPPPVSAAIPPTPPQQKTPPPLSRRKKANMSNIHHISNHRPSRQLTSEGGGGIGSGTRSVSGQNQHQPHAAGHQETTVPGMDHPTTTTSLFANEWMCVFCEYKLLYGEYPRMMGAVKSRKKLVAKKKDAQERAHRATTVGAPASTKSRMQCTCGRAHARAMQAVAKELGDDGHDHDHHHHQHHDDDDHHHHGHEHDHDHDHHSHQHHHHHHHHQEQHTTPAKLPPATKQQASKT